MGGLQAERVTMQTGCHAQAHGRVSVGERLSHGRGRTLTRSRRHAHAAVRVRVCTPLSNLQKQATPRIFSGGGVFEKSAFSRFTLPAHPLPSLLFVSQDSAAREATCVGEKP